MLLGLVDPVDTAGPCARLLVGPRRQAGAGWDERVAEILGQLSFSELKLIEPLLRHDRVAAGKANVAIVM